MCACMMNCYMASTSVLKKKKDILLSYVEKIAPNYNIFLR
jgi:hypothetical protein